MVSFFLTGFGAELCASALGGPGALRVERCGLSLNTTPVTLELRAASTLLAPEQNATIGVDTSVSWSENAHAIFDLAFEPDDESTLTPTVHVFTTANTATLPDLRALGVPQLVGSSYALSVGAIGPFDSLDHALGPVGLAAVIRAESWTSYSPAIPIFVSD